jgi:hypothetical protein
VKKIKVVAKKPENHKSLIKVQFMITYIDSSIVGPLGFADPLIHSFEIDGQLVQPLPKQFLFRLQLQAVEVRNPKSRSKKPLQVIPLGFIADIMDSGQLYHRPYTKAEIKKMRDDYLGNARQI